VVVAYTQVYVLTYHTTLFYTNQPDVYGIRLTMFTDISKHMQKVKNIHS